MGSTPGNVVVFDSNTGSDLCGPAFFPGFGNIHVGHHLHTQAESGAYLRDSSKVPRRRPFMKPPYAIGSVPSLSGHAIAYRWRSLPRVRRHRASKPQASSERVLPWQVTMDQLIFASLSHTHYWYGMGMLKKYRRLCGSFGHDYPVTRRTSPAEGQSKVCHETVVYHTANVLGLIRYHSDIPERMPWLIG